MPASTARDGEPILPGHIYVAPPDRHVLVTANGVRLVRGPHENRHRPAIDPMFRTAARFGGTRVIGVVLSGAIDDGTSGLFAIKQRGRIANHKQNAEVIRRLIIHDPEPVEGDNLEPSNVRLET